MWVWGFLGDLARTVFRGLGRLYLGGIALVFFATGAVSLLSRAPETAVAAAAGVMAVDAEASVAENARAAAENYRWTREMSRDDEHHRARRGDVASQWERDRREHEADNAIRSAFDSDYE